MDERADRLVEIAREILRHEERIAALRAEFARVASDEPPRRSDRGRVSLAREILDFLATRAGAVAAYEIVAALPHRKVESIYATLSKLAKSGRLVAPRHGYYERASEPSEKSFLGRELDALALRGGTR